MDIEKVLSMTTEDRLRLIEFDVLEKKDIHYLLSCGKLDSSELKAVKELMAKKQLQEIRDYVKEVHPHKITPPTPGCAKPRYRTHIDIVDEVTGKKKRKEISKTHEMDLYQWLYEYYSGTASPEIVEVFTLYTLYPDWMEYKKGHTKADSNIPRVESTWKKYYEHADISKIDIRQLSVLQLDIWIHQMIQGHEMNRRKFNNFILILRQMLRYAVLRGIIPSSPLDKVEINTKLLVSETDPDSETQVFNQEEEEAIVSLAWTDYQTNKRLRYPLSCLAVIFQFLTGLRIGELCAIRYEDIRGNFLYVKRMVTEQYHIVNHTKSWRGNRKVFLTEEALDIIEETRRYHKANGQSDAIYVFGAAEHLLPRTVTDRYSAYCKKLGILHRSSHKARKTYVSKLLDGGLNPKTVSQSSGHDIATMMKHYEFDRSTTQELEAKFSSALPAHSGVQNGVHSGVHKCVHFSGEKQ